MEQQEGIWEGVHVVERDDGEHWGFALSNW